MENTVFQNYKGLLVNAFKNTTAAMLHVDFISEEGSKIGERKVVKVIVSIVGGYRGRIIFTVGESTCRSLANKFMGEEVTDEMEILACISEILNIVTGRFVTDINNLLKKQELRITPPAVFQGEDIDISSPNVQSEILTFVSQAGTVSLDIGFEEEV